MPSDIAKYALGNKTASAENHWYRKRKLASGQTDMSHLGNLGTITYLGFFNYKCSTNSYH